MAHLPDHSYRICGNFFGNPFEVFWVYFWESSIIKGCSGASRRRRLLGATIPALVCNAGCGGKSGVQPCRKNQSAAPLPPKQPPAFGLLAGQRRIAGGSIS